VLVLASGSPRRRELLKRLRLDYEVRAADIDESPHLGEQPTALARRLAETKAVAVSGDLVLAADTVVARGATLYAKPADEADAARMLRELAGRDHVVITGVALASRGRVVVRALASHVSMRVFTEQEIAAYVASGDPLDKAGAYAVQNEQFRPVERLTGCRCNVVGFPIGVVGGLLREAGVEPPVAEAAACPYGAFSPADCCSRT